MSVDVVQGLWLNRVMDNLTHSDLALINRLARLYVRDGNMSALQEAQGLLAGTLNEQEHARVLWWWNEGCRDYAGSEERLAEMNAALISTS